jgi:hypothetical protein
MENWMRKNICVHGLIFVTCLLYGFAVSANCQQASPTDDLNVALMQSTFKIVGPGAAAGTSSTGTVFLLGSPMPNANNLWKMVLVTANHVFDGIRGDFAELELRRRDANGNWTQYPVRIRIRKGTTPLWTKNPNADVAVAYVRPPVQIFDQVVPVSVLADDKMLSDYKVTPGTELNCLGYPYGLAANDAGFPILRGGLIASYPVLPTAATKTFLFDFRVFGGNSGGPVYFSQPLFRGNASIGPRAQFLVGLVTEQEIANAPQPVPLSIGVVVHASVIKRTIEMLPPPESPEVGRRMLELTVIPPGAKSLDF